MHFFAYCDKITDVEYCNRAEDVKMEISEKFKGISPSPTLLIDAKFKQMKADGLDVVGFGAGEPGL